MDQTNTQAPSTSLPQSLSRRDVSVPGRQPARVSHAPLCVTRHRGTRKTQETQQWG
jgi:hypothetical protein